MSVHAEREASTSRAISSPPSSEELQAATTKAKPTLIFFYSPTSGSSRRVEGFLAQVLQRRRNHETFTVRHIDYDAHGDVAARLGVEEAPAIVVVEEKRLRARLERPRGCADINTALAPWLR